MSSAHFVSDQDGETFGQRVGGTPGHADNLGNSGYLVGTPKLATFFSSLTYCWGLRPQTPEVF